MGLDELRRPGQRLRDRGAASTTGDDHGRGADEDRAAAAATARRRPRVLARSRRGVASSAESPAARRGGPVGLGLATGADDDAQLPGAAGAEGDPALTERAVPAAAATATRAAHEVVDVLGFGRDVHGHDGPGDVVGARHHRALLRGGDRRRGRGDGERGHGPRGAPDHGTALHRALLVVGH